jgi:GT2 family glycosyltransferase
MARRESDLQDVSICLCSRDRRKDLEILVDKLKAVKTSYQVEIIVVEETNDPCEIEGVRYFPHLITNRGIPFARNLALKYATGQIVVFIDDDCSVGEDWLERLLEPLRNKEIVGVQGGVTVPSGSKAIGWAESILGFPGGGLSRVLQAKGENQRTREISTLNCAYRKWVIEKIGGFDEDLVLGSEDYLLAKQACQYGSCLFVPQAMVFHAARGNFRKIWNWFVRRGRAEMQLVKLRKIEETKPGSILKSSITCKFLLIVLAGALLPGFFAPLILSAFACYYILQLCRHYRPWKLSNASLTTIFLLPFVKLVMDAATDWGRARGILFG